MEYQQVCECQAAEDGAEVLTATDEACRPVTRLADASAAVQEAFAWLGMRGFVERLCDQSGERIKVLKRPEASQIPAEASL